MKFKFIMDFVKLLTSTSKNQAYALLYTATPDQLTLICEILHNLQQGVFPSTKKVKELTARHKKLLKTFIVPPPKTKRLSSVRKNTKKIYDILLSLKKYILQLWSTYRKWFLFPSKSTNSF